MGFALTSNPIPVQSIALPLVELTVSATLNGAALCLQEVVRERVGERERERERERDVCERGCDAGVNATIWRSSVIAITRVYSGAVAATTDTAAFSTISTTRIY